MPKRIFAAFSQCAKGTLGLDIDYIRETQQNILTLRPRFPAKQLFKIPSHVGKNRRRPCNKNCKQYGKRLAVTRVQESLAPFPPYQTKVQYFFLFSFLFLRPTVFDPPLFPPSRLQTTVEWLKEEGTGWKEKERRSKRPPRQLGIGFTYVE